MNQNILGKFYKDRDITQQIAGCLNSMVEGDIVLAKGFTLYDSMSATELFDKKIDVKVDLKLADTPLSLLNENKIKKSEDLTEQEILSIFDLVLGKELLWYKGHALAQTVYTLVQLYDPTFTDNNEIIDILYRSLNSMGSAVYQIVKSAPFLKEEDYIPSVFSFKKNSLPIPNMILDYLNPLDSKVQQKLKKKKNLTVMDGISARIKLRKGMAQLLQSMSVQYSEESQEQIKSQIEFIRKRIDIVKQTAQLGVNVDHYWSRSIFKHIYTIVSQRVIPEATLDQTLSSLENMLAQMEGVLLIARERNLFLIIEKIDDLIHRNPKNTVVRAYLETNLFKFDQITYFQQVPLINIVKNFLVSLYPNFSEAFESKQPEFISYMEYLASICYEYIIKMLRGNFRQLRDFHKLYQHFSMLIHESTKTDELLFKRQKTPLMIMGYELALKMMIKQLTLGFELDIYDYCDYQYVYYQLEYLTQIYERNRNNYLSTLPQASQQALVTKNKKKKQVNEVQELYYNEMSFWKAFQIFCKAYSRLCYILAQVGLVPNFLNDEFKYRYSNRMRIFEYCYFIKPVTYEEYIQRMEEVYKDKSQLTDALNWVSDQLKEALNLFRQLPVEEKNIPSFFLSQQKSLIKVCVVTSVNLMKIKMSIDKLDVLKVKFTNQCDIPYMPQLDLV